MEVFQSNGWAYGAAAGLLVIALFYFVFKKWPPAEGKDDSVAPPPR